MKLLVPVIITNNMEEIVIVRKLNEKSLNKLKCDENKLLPNIGF